MKKENRIFVIAAIMVLAVDILSAQDGLYKVPMIPTILIAAAMLIMNITVIKKKQSEAYRLVRCVGMILLLFLLLVWTCCIVRVHYYAEITVVWIVTICIAVAMIAFLAMVVLRYKEVNEDCVLLVILLGMMLRIFYVIMTQAHIYQNDTGTLANSLGGHLGYVRYLMDHHALPDFDPVSRHQFYQPPLYYILSAVWAQLHLLFGVTWECLDEKLQLLSLFYTTVSLGYLNKIGLRLSISACGRLLALGIVSFMPYSVMMAGANNNDALMLMLMIMSVYYTVKWYQDSLIRDIFLMGLTIGLAMMTKISGVLIAPGMACIMLYKVWRERRLWKTYMLQFAVFAVTAFPLGLWHPLRSWLVYEMPLGYVPNMGTDSSQFIGMFMGTQRLFDVGEQLRELCLHWDNSLSNIDYNIPISLVKYAVFGEGTYYLCNDVVKMIGTWMFWFTALILVITAVLNVILLFQKKLPVIYKVSLGLMIVVIMFSYVKFCYLYPHVCTMHVRYIMAAVFISALGSGAAISAIEENQSEKRKILMGSVVVLMVFIYGCLAVMLNWNMEILLQST